MKFNLKKESNYRSEKSPYSFVKKNPSKEELMAISKGSGMLRCFLVDSNLYCWNPYDGLHRNVAESLKITNRDPISFMAFVNDEGYIEGVTFTDFLSGTKWFQNPRLLDTLMSNKRMDDYLSQNFTDDDVVYYDQAIDGPWHEMPDDEEELLKTSSFEDMSPSHVEKSKYMDSKYFLEDVKDDLFIHFTTMERAQEIINSNTLMTNANSPYDGFGAVGAFAVSTKYGEDIPGVQTTHISKETSELVGVLFSTDQKPERGTVDEVIWNSDVKLKESSLISYQDAMSLLNEKKESDDDYDQNYVIYDEDSDFFKWVADDQQKKSSNWYSYLKKT